MGQTAVVKTIFGETDPFTVGCTTRQRCRLASILFNIYDEAMLKEHSKMLQKEYDWRITY